MNRGWRKDKDFTKRNQHYVPQFWQKRFQDDQNIVFVRYRAADDPSKKRKGIARPASTKNTMTADWPYTVFDKDFLPYDTLENALAADEAKISQTEKTLLTVGAVITPSLHVDFCYGIALALCRLPAVMRHGLGVAKSFAYELARVHEMDRTEFDALFTKINVAPPTNDEYQHMKSLTPEELLAYVIRIDDLSPQSQALPEQNTLLAAEKIGQMILSMDLEIVEGATGPLFIVGDQPIRGINMFEGFSVPLSKSAAAVFKPPQGQTASCSRRMVLAAEVEAINRDQWDRCRTHVIGSDQAYLDSL